MIDNALNKAVVSAVREILSDGLGWEITSYRGWKAPINYLKAETSVVIGFVGKISGAFTLKCSSELAAAMASQMLGMEVAPASEEMKDAVGEILNMIVGSAKTKYAASNSSLKMSVPTTIVGRDYVLHIQAERNAETSLLEFRCPQGVLNIEIYIREGGNGGNAETDGT